MEVWISFHILYSDTKSRSMCVLIRKLIARVKIDLPIIQHGLLNHIMKLD